MAVNIGEKERLQYLWNSILVPVTENTFFAFFEKKKRMTYDTIFARSFSRHEQRKLGCCAFAGFSIIAMTIFIAFKPFLCGSQPILNLQLSMGASLNILMRTNETLVPRQPYPEVKEVKPICNIEQQRSDACDMDGDIRVNGNSSTIFIASRHTELLEGNHSWNIKPYARKHDRTAMGRVRTIAIRRVMVSKDFPDCSRNYSIPAIVFSTGGYAGNHFHDFTDVLIPLYLTSIQFGGEVQFLLTDKQSWWTKKYTAVLQKLSKYEIIDVDHENEVLCFPRIIVGLKSHKEFGIDSSKSSFSMKDFREFLRRTYSLRRESVNNLINVSRKRRRLLIITRSKTRKLLNAGELADMAENLGFDVVSKETGSNLAMVSEVVNSVDVLVGVHGAGLTNMVFLPENAVIIQIIPLGNFDFLARTDFEEPAVDMNLRYLQYKISPNESSLVQQYSYDDQIFNDTGPNYKNGWLAFRSIFLDKQDVMLDISRFRKVLLQAHELL